MIDSLHGTTIVVVKKDGHVAMAGDGQVTMSNSIMKSSAKKVRKIFHGSILVGFAGATADAFTLFERFEKVLEKYNGDLRRAAVELAKAWRTDRMLRRLEALLLTADKKQILLISGTGDVLDPDYETMAIGSGGNFAYSAAMAYLENKDLSAVDIVKRALLVASRICIYTNSEITVEEL